MLPTGYAALDILIVDDIAHTRHMLRGILRHLGFLRVSEAAGGVEAYEAIKAQPPDLVFTDWDMPGGSGYDLIRAVRTRPDSPDPTLPVILVTGHGSQRYVQAARDAGATDFLVKPFSPIRIRERILHVVARPRGFICTPTYQGPDRRRQERAVPTDRRDPDAPRLDVTLLPPDPVLMAKVSGDRDALQSALRQRAEGMRRLSGEGAKAGGGDAAAELEGLIGQALGALDRCSETLARMAAPLAHYRAMMSARQSPPALRVLASLQRMISDPSQAVADAALVRLHLLALRAMLRAGTDPAAERTAAELADQIDALAARPRRLEAVPGLAGTGKGALMG